MTAPDQPAETPMRDHVAKVLDFMAAGGAICIMDIPGDASCTSHTFGGDVSLAVVDFIRNTRAPLAEAHPLAAEARAALERDDVAGWIGSLPKAPLAETLAVPEVAALVDAAETLLNRCTDEDLVAQALMRNLRAKIAALRAIGERGDG